MWHYHLPNKTANRGTAQQSEFDTGVEQVTARKSSVDDTVNEGLDIRGPGSRSIS